MKNLMASFALMLLAFKVSPVFLESTTKGCIGKKSAACKGIGFCFGSNANEGELTFTFRFEPVSSTLSILLDENEIRQKQSGSLQYFKDKNRFQLEEDVKLPEPVVTDLKLHDDVISKGMYTLQYQNGKYILIIRK